MIGVVPRQSRSKILILVVVWLLLVVIGSVSYLGWRQSVPGVEVTTPAPRFVGHKTALTVGLQARRGNIATADVRVAQGGRSWPVAQLDGVHRSRADGPG